MTFLLILLLFFLLFPYIIKLILKLVAYSYKRKFTKFANQYTNGQQAGNYNSQAQQEKHHKRRRKIFDKNDGEYVNFEEIQEERTVTPSDNDRTFVDDRITDVKFEEIKDSSI